MIYQIQFYEKYLTSYSGFYQDNKTEFHASLPLLKVADFTEEDGVKGCWNLSYHSS